MVGYHCTGSAMGMIDVDIEMDVDIHANVPESVKSEEDFSIDNSYTEVSMGVTDILRTAANPLIGEVSQFELELDNANFNGSNTVDVAELANGSLDFGPIDIEDDDEVVGFRVPGESGIDVPLKAGDSGVIEVKPGEIVTEVEAGLAGIEIDVEVTCSPTEDKVLNEIPIEDDGNGEDPEPDPEEEALDAINEAGDAEEMQEALNNDDLGLDLSEFDELTEAEQAEVTNQMLENRPSDGFADANAVNEALGEAISEVTEEPEEPGNGDNPEEEALQTVNDAETAKDMRAAIEDEELGLNLAAYNGRNTYQQNKIADHMLENRPEEDFADSEAVQDALNNANFELYISPTRPDDPVEDAFNAVNNAENAEDMQEALQNEDLGLNVGEYNQLSDDEKAEVAETVLDNRPDDDEGYPLPEDIQLALDNAVEAVEEDEDGQDGEDGEDGQDGEDGEDGQDGEDGEDGQDGEDGEDGQDGEDGEDGQDGQDGEDGEDGQDGEDGEDGQDGEDGEDGSDGDDGKDGKNNNGYKKDDQSSSGAVTKSDNNNGSGGSLPDTATTNPLFILLGSIMAVGGGALVFIRRKIMG